VLALLTRAGELRIAQVTERKNLLTGQTVTRLREGRVPVALPEDRLPDRLLLAGLGDTVLLTWSDGRLQRYDTRVATNPVWAETVDLLAEPDARLTQVEFLVGKTSLVAGDSLGRTRVWFCTKPADATTVDGAVLVQAHDLPAGDAAVVALAPSARSRVLAVGYGDGTACLFHVTSQRLLTRTPTAPQVPTWLALTMAPKDDALVSFAQQDCTVWSVHAPHPEITWAAILGRVHYEGSQRPEHVWQSSSGTDDFEEKYGLMPLVFGTLKATLYSMLFAVPLAVLAAIYTSEFLHPRIKARVKPTIEVMASLPSVVLGFLAALFFAPLVEGVLPACLTALVTVPFAFLLGASLWQLLPVSRTDRGRHLRLLGMLGALPAGLLLAATAGPVVERWLFAGDIMAWLDGRDGTGVGAWVFFLLPLSALLVAGGGSRWLPRRAAAAEPTARQIEFGSLVRFLGGSGLAVLLAWGAAVALTALGWDPRGTLVGTYVQRNSLIVGAMMGFAVIPIIYTIADDALSAVPESLRAASLASGATPWQTAVRIVIPTAMSGLFSAMMVGLGRAVGETMIVLMAAGNTPVMELNIFNGFRTLSANIATELPEAVANSTHYRMLFLAALMLFAITFAVNSLAEVIRLRFRRRAYQL
jgi:phosphate transport system permease protein